MPPGTAERRDRLVTWIDMNTPAYGTWLEIPTVRHRQQYLEKSTGFFSNWLRPAPGDEIQGFRQRRRELLLKYGVVDDDPESVPPSPVTPPGWPFDTAEAHPWQRIFNVGFRVVCEADDS